MSQPDIWQLLNRIPQPEQPFITTIEAQGRVELSGRTVINGICKAANAFRDILEAEPGQSAYINLGWTWQQSVWQGAALVAGLTLATDSEAAHEISPSVISTHPLGLPTGGPDDITSDVLSQPDVWLYPDYFSEQLSLVEQTRAWAVEHGINTGDRIGLVTSAAPPQAIEFLPFLVPLTVYGSVVIFDQHTSDIARLLEQEKVTVLLRQ